jgi:PKD repeat protein
VCAGFSANLTATIISGAGPFTFSWSPNVGLSSTTSQTVTCSPPSTTLYTVSVYDYNGCSASDTAYVTVNPLPTISVSALNGGIINSGNSETLTATGASTYSWTDGISNIGATSTITVTPLVSTTYTVYGTDVNGCTSDTNYTVTVISSSLSLSVNVTDAICAGQSNGAIDLVVTGGTSPYTYSWSNGAVTEDLTNISAGTYFVTVTDAQSYSSTISATVNEPMPITVYTNSLINETCSGANGEISISAYGGTPGYTYSWSNNQTGASINGLTAGTYTVTVTDTNGCIKTASFAITDTFITYHIHGTALLDGNFLPDGKAYLFKITDTTAYFPLDSAVLNYFGEFDLNINIPGGYMVMIKPDYYLHPNAPPYFYGNTHRWRLADTLNAVCAWSDTIAININSYNPAVGGNGIINGTVIDITDTTDQRRPGEPIRGIDIILENNPGGNIINRTSTDSNGEYNFTGLPNGNYRLFVLVPGCTMINTYHLTINGNSTYLNRDFYLDSLDGYIDTSTVVKMQACSFTPLYAATTVCLNDTTHFIDLSLSVPTNICGYRWDFNGDNVADDTTKGNVSIVYPTAGVFNTSLIIFSYDGTCSDTARLSVTVNDLPRVVVNDTVVCSGNPLMLTAGGASVYSWVSNSSIDSTINEYAYINTTTPFIKSFYVFGTDVNGCTNSDTADVIINQTPQANFVIINNNICFGNIAEFKDTSSNIVTGTTYSWDFNNDGITEDTLTGSINFLYAAPGNYNVELKLVSPFGCKDSIIKPITVRNNPLIVSAGYDKSIICGASTPLQAYCNTNGVSYLWSPNYYLGNPFTASTTATPDTTTSYVIKVSKDGCSAYDTVIVYVTPLTADAGNDQQITCGNTITLNATSNGVAGTLYQWTPGAGLNSQTVLKPTASPITTTTYTLTVYKNTCIATDTVTVFVDPLNISAGSDKTIICGQSTTLTATSSGSTGLTWSWSPASGLNNTSTSTVTASPSVTTNYILTGTKGNCITRDTVQVVVTPFNVYAGPDKTIDCGNSTQLQATSYYTSGATYSWIPSNGLSNSLSLTPTANPTTTTTYTLTVVKGNCISTDTVRVNVNQNIPISFTADKTIFANKYPPYTVKFTNNTPNSNNYVFNWNFGDGSPIITAKNYTYSYQIPGTFTVSLYAQDLSGACKDTLTYVDYIVAWSPTALPNLLAVDYTIDLYPNPTNDKITIGINDLSLTEGFVSILDITGKIIKVESIQVNAENKMMLDLSNLSNGVYFIKIENDDQVVVKRIIKE